MAREDFCICCGEEINRWGGTTTHFCIGCHGIQRDEAKRAIQVVSDAKRRGDIPKADTLTCVDCGAPASVYDHRDYSKPMAIKPVCRACNVFRGPALSSVYRPKAEA